MNRIARFLLLGFCLMISSLALALRDPTQPLDRAVLDKKTPTLIVQAIYSSGDYAKVIINGQPYRAGERVQGWTVIKIDSNTVLLRRGQESKSLKLRESLLAS